MSNQDYSIENLISRKKRRKNREKISDELEKLFAELQRTPDERHDSPTNTNYIQETEESPKTMDMKEAVETAQKYLEREKSDKLAQILEDDEEVTSEKNYNYFGSNIKVFPQVVLPDEIMTFKPLSPKKVVYTKIYHLANDRLGRRQLISNGWLSHYHKRGLEYPLSVYRWLFRIAAYEGETDLCNDAKKTLLSLWKDLGSQETSADQIRRRTANRRAIPWQDFQQVLEAYGAAEQEIAWARQLVRDANADQPSPMEEIQSSSTNTGQRTSIRSFPISNARCIVQLFGQSVWQSQSCYSPGALSYIIVLLIQMSMDERCEAIQHDIETAINCCLISYDQSAWRKEMDSMVTLLSSQFLNGDIQLKSLNTLKSVSERSNHFRRTLAMSYLLTGSTTCDRANLNQVYGSSAPCTPQSNYSEDMQSSNDSTSALSEISNRQHPVSIESQIEPLIRSGQLLGLNSNQLDAHKLTCTVHLLSVSIGDDEEEIKSQRSSVEKIIRSLQHLSKRIGGKVGSLDRTIAREVVERLWSRLAYVIGPRSHRTIESTQVPKTKCDLFKPRQIFDFLDVLYGDTALAFDLGSTCLFFHSDIITMSNVREYLYKFLVVGDLGTGKTSIIKRYVHNIFSMHYKSTIGVDFALKVIQWSPEIVVRLQLWDIAGQERFGNMTRVYYKEALGAFVVYDVTRPQTFEGVRKWKADLDSKISLPEVWGGGNIPVVLLANKSDLINEGHGQHVNAAEMDTFCKENGFIKWFETSAKDNTNIDEAARHLVTSILAIEREHLDRHDAENFESNNQQLRVDSRDKTRNDGGCC